VSACIAGAGVTARLAVFARPPVAGAAKTRLAPAVGHDGAARLASAFLADTMASAAHARDTLGLVLELWSADAAPHPELVNVARAHGAVLRAQPAGDLGARMRAAIDAGEAGHGTLIVGTDAPTAPRHAWARARRALETHDVVLGPTADGGYWLLGARAPLPASFFDGVPWSAPTTRAATVAAAARLGLRVAHLAPWYDVDGPDDLRLLRAHLALTPQDAPETTRALAGLNAGAP